MTFYSFKTDAVNRLTVSRDINTAKNEVDKLIISLSGMTLAQLLINKDKEINALLLEKLESALLRLENNEPLQYILGKWEFCGLDIFCGKGCLIPRPETELLAQFAIDNLPQNGKFLDLCTGSGCIPCAILNYRKDVSGVGVDISEDALVYANKNIDFYSFDNRFKTVLSDVKIYEPDFFPDIIISNPPYVKSADMDFLQKELYYEPSIALDGGQDGMDFYNIITLRYSKYLKKGGKIAFEVGFDTAQNVEILLKSNGFETKSIIDFNGIARVITGLKNT